MCRNLPLGHIFGSHSGNSVAKKCRAAHLLQVASDPVLHVNSPEIPLDRGVFTFPIQLRMRGNYAVGGPI